MNALENSVLFKIPKEMTIFLTYIDNLSLKVYCCTPFGLLIYENH
jgi:hypothetical protein